MYLNIAICDERESDCMALVSQLHTVAADLGLTVQISVFTCNERFLRAHQEAPYDIVFMDICKSGIAGLETVCEAVRTYPCQCIFTAESRDYALEAFAVNAAHYLLKPLCEDGIREAVKRCLPRLSDKGLQYLIIKTGHGIVPVSTESLSYIEVTNKICTLHTEGHCLSTYMSLKALFSLLDPSCFMRPQRSFVVNMHFIAGFFFDHIVLKDGTAIVLSRNHRSELKKQYQQFLHDLAGR